MKLSNAHDPRAHTFCKPVLARPSRVERERRSIPLTTNHRILSPVLLPYLWYWKHVAVMINRLDFKAITIPPRSVHIAVALG